VHGATDAEGDKVTEGEVTVPNLFATAVSALGLDPTETRLSPAGRPIAITDGGQPVRALLL
jgi:hypothetical protein